MADDTPVVLIGVDFEKRGIGAVGLYESAERARQAVNLGEVPSGLTYSVMTPAMNGCVVPHVWSGTCPEKG